MILADRPESSTLCREQQDYDLEEEGVQFKMMNNSTVMPLKHSRYTNDES